MSLDPQAALAALGKLSDLGLTWKPAASNRYEPGIPSPMAYALTDGEDVGDKRTCGEVPPEPGGPSLPAP